MTSFDDAKNVQIDVRLPETVFEITQTFEHTQIQDVYQAVKTELAGSGLLERMRPNSRVAVAVGSRGLANIALIAKAVVDTFREHGFDPFVTPAMGSHGGGTAEGQVEMLAGFGVTESYLGVPVQATMDVRVVGQIPGGPTLFQDTLSSAADYTFLINRVKVHTDFHGELESGLTKMLVIGLGKKTGATEMHEGGVAAFQKYLVPAARMYEENSNVIGGLAVVENGYDETAIVQALHISEIGKEKEKALLAESRRQMASLAFKDIDVLVVRELGKNISGTGMDTNIICRLMIPREKEDFGAANIATISVLDLTEETHGNVSGLGLANTTTRRVLEKIDWFATYTNSLTSGIFGMQRVSLPIVMSNDDMAIRAAVRGCGTSPEKARIVFIENTLRLDRMWISPSLVRDAQQIERISVHKQIPLSFSPTGGLCSPWQMSEVFEQA